MTGVELAALITGIGAILTAIGGVIHSIQTRKLAGVAPRRIRQRSKHLAAMRGRSVD